MTTVPHPNRGFSLVELTAVLVVLGIVLAVAAPRMDAGRGVSELGFAEQFLDDLRVAQRRAEADGCEVRVAITASSVAFDQRAALCSGPFNRPVSTFGAAGSQLDAAPPEGMPLAAAPPVFYFDSSGSVLDSAGGAPVNVAITIGTRRIDITGATGYATF